MAKVVVIHKVRKSKTNKEVEFEGSEMWAMSQALTYIYNNQPIEIVAIRRELSNELATSV